MSAEPALPDAANNSGSSRPLSRRLLRWLLIFLFSLLILVAMLVALLPSIANVAAVHWLKQQGVQASIEKIDIDFNDGIVQVIGAHGTNSASRGFRLDRFYFDFAWQPLLDNVLRIEALRVEGFSLDTEQNAQGMQSVAGLELASQQSSPAQQAPASAGKPWRVEVANVRLENIQSCHEIVNANQRFCLQLKSFEWLGNLFYDMSAAAAEQLQIAAGLTITGLEIIDDARAQVLISGGAIELSGLSLQSLDNIAVKRLRFDNWLLMPGKTATGAEQIVRIDGLQLDDMMYGRNRLALSRLAMEGVGASIQRDRQGAWEITQRLQQLQPAGDGAEKSLDQQPATTATSQQSNAEPMSIKIDELVFTESHPVVFVDETQPTPFKLSARIKAFSVQNINITDPDAITHIQLQVVADEYGSIELDGDMQLPLDTGKLDFNANIRGVDLRPVSAYIQSGLGHRINSGHLNAQIKLVSNSGKLDGSMDLDLQQLQLKKQQQDEQGSIDQDIGIPLDTALNLLRDRDNSIKLKIPVSGDINNPEFDPSHAIQKAASKAISAAVINYYTPFGLVTAVQGLFDLATALRFEPVTFAAGSVDLMPEQIEYLDTLLQLMTSRPALHLSLCGFSNAQDLAALIPELAPMLKQEDYRPDPDSLSRINAVASERAARVKAYLVDKGIAAERLILCEGEYNAEAVAGVEISI